MDYKQAHFYRFNSDSISLVHFILSINLKSSSILDLCAGCGVIGIELINKMNEVQSLEFVEVLDENIKYIEENIKLCSRKNLKTKIFNDSVGEFNPSTTYDLIVCNPPYFIQGEGRESSNYNRQVSRTFMIDSPEILILKAISLLSANGQFFLLIPNDEKSWSLLIEKYELKLQKKLERASIFLFSKSNTN
jgi:tRNA1(Val) A37 N6-methylase TrmN6